MEEGSGKTSALAAYLKARRELEGGLFLDRETADRVRRLFLTLEEFEREIETCRKCPLGETRNKFVFGDGNSSADIVIVGEAPGRDEDLQGKPFVGRAGKLLDQILLDFGLSRKDVYICNILKCRPPNNRDPLQEEIELCEPYLHKQLKIIRPRIIVALGRISAQTLLRTTTAIGRLRGNTYLYEGIPLVVTYHTAAVLRNPSLRRGVEEDMNRVLSLAQKTGSE